MDSILSVKDVSFYYGDLKILDSVNAEVERGHVFGIVGPNGGGKSTLLKIIAGLLKPAGGSVSFDFRNGVGRSIGYMPQHASVNWKFPIKVLDVIMMGSYGELGLVRRPGRREREVARRAAERMGVEKFMGRHISELSGGQQQRVFIARALASEPELLLLDEPASNIDSESQDRLYELIEQLRDELGLTIMIVTHDLMVIPKICKQVACVNRQVYVHDRPDNITCPVSDEYLGDHKEIFLHGEIPHRVVRRKDGG